jgi:hypothetical protein
MITLAIRALLRSSAHATGAIPTQAANPALRDAFGHCENSPAKFASREAIDLAHAES